MSTFWRYAAYAFAGLAALILFAILAAVFLISIGVLLPQSSEPAGISGITPQALSVVRSYLFRNAVRNTISVLAFTLPIAFLFGLAGVALAGQSRRGNGTMAWLLLVPLAMPVALAMPGWRQIFAPTLALAGEAIWPTLLAIAAIQAWRILPFATLFLLLAWPLNRRSPAIGLTLCFSAYVVISDAVVVLLLNGGAPFNASHGLASWIYQTGVAGGRPVHSAIMTLLLLPLLALAAWGIVHFAGKLQSHMVSRNPKPEPDKLTPLIYQPILTFGQLLLAGLAMVALLLPLSVPLVMSLNVADWPSTLGQLFGNLDYGYWLANTVVLAGMTALAVVVVSLPIGRQLVGWKSPWSGRLSSASGILGLVTLPISFIPLMALQAERHSGDGRWLLTLIYASTGICIGIWLAYMVLQDRGVLHENELGERSSLIKWLVLLCLLIVTHEMAAALVLSNGRSQTLGMGSGLANRLVFDPSIAPTVIGIAILLPTILLLLFYWWLLRGSIGPWTKPTKNEESL